MAHVADASRLGVCVCVPSHSHAALSVSANSPSLLPATPPLYPPPHHPFSSFYPISSLSILLTHFFYVNLLHSPSSLPLAAIPPPPPGAAEPEGEAERHDAPYSLSRRRLPSPPFTAPPCTSHSIHPFARRPVTTP